MFKFIRIYIIIDPLLGCLALQLFPIILSLSHRSKVMKSSNEMDIYFTARPDKFQNTFDSLSKRETK